MSIGYFFIIYEEWDDVQINRNEKEQKKKSWLIQFSVKWLWNNKCLTVIISCV